MVICKYFLRGTCRFGESCKNEHAYNNADTTTSVMRKKGEIDANALIKSVSNDMDKAEKGNQWPLSCYGPFQAKPCFPGFDDKCFEEIRLGMYEAEKNGTVEQYKQQLTQLLHEARMKMRSLQNPTAEATHVLQELYNANVSEQQTSNVFANATNTFGNSQIQSNSVFNNTTGSAKSIFNNQVTPSYSFAVPENKSIFGNTAPNTNSIFAQTNQQNFASGGGIFGGNQIQQQQNQSFQSANIFKNANNSIFGAQPGTATNQSPFGGAQPGATNQSPFGGAQPGATTQSPFGGAQPVQSTNIFTQNNPPPNPFKQNIQASATGQSPFGAAPVQQSPFTSTFGPISNQSPFGGFTPNTNSNQTPFASTPPSNQNQSVFAQPQPSYGGTNQSPFNANTPPVNQSPFISSTSSSFNTNPSPFAPPSGTITENRSIFAQQASIGQNSQTSATDHSKSIFGSSQSTIVAAPATRQDDPTVYSKLEALTENDVKSFEANTFEFGKIPDKPPTLQMCS